MGNMARRISDAGATENIKSSDGNAAIVHKEMPKIDYPYEISGYPRFARQHATGFNGQVFRTVFIPTAKVRMTIRMITNVVVSG